MPPATTSTRSCCAGWRRRRPCSTAGWGSPAAPSAPPPGCTWRSTTGWRSGSWRRSRSTCAPPMSAAPPCAGSSRSGAATRWPPRATSWQRTCPRRVPARCPGQTTSGTPSPQAGTAPMPADRLFGPTFTTAAMAATVSDTAWLRAMLDFEAALARAEARVGVIPAAAAEAIAAACAAADLDIEAIGRQAADSGTPVVPMLEALRARLPAGAAPHLHWGATSQDVLDTAMMLLAGRGLGLLAADLDVVAAAAAGLARAHGATLMPARTLLQQAA